MLQTSILKLDELMNGGIDSAKSVLFYSQPGVDDNSFMQQILFHRLSEGDNAIYLVNNKIPKVLKAVTYLSLAYMTARFDRMLSERDA